jgi:hypothetical protein
MPVCVTVKVTPGSSPNFNVRIFAMALLLVACPDGYSGWGGVAMNGSQVASATVESLPSALPFLMADCGRQKLNSYFASQQAMLASAEAT